MKKERLQYLILGREILYLHAIYTYTYIQYIYAEINSRNVLNFSHVFILVTRVFSYSQIIRTNSERNTRGDFRVFKRKKIDSSMCY